MPAGPTRGLLFEFAARGVPVIHLLHVRGLAKDNGLPYDPVPLPVALK
jgi:poly-gamma-glutamate system protein